MLWLDKYTPMRLDDLTVHPKLNERLKLLSKDRASLPHILMYGGEGAGKRTRALALLRELFGTGVDSVRIDKVGDVAVPVSDFHIHVSCGDLGTRDADGIMALMERFRHTTNTVDWLRGSRRAGDEVAATPPPYRVVVLQDAHLLSHKAQAALRRTMESNVRAIRVILLVTNMTDVIDPLRSRCAILAVRTPEPAEARALAERICAAEGLDTTRLPALLALAGGDLRRVVLALESQHVTGAADALPWETQVARLCADVLRHGTMQELVRARSALYDLLGLLVPPQVLLVRATDAMLQNTDKSLHPQIAQIAAYISTTLANSGQPVIHLQAFLANVLAAKQAQKC